MEDIPVIERIKVTEDFLELQVSTIGTILLPAIDNTQVVVLNKITNASLIPSAELLALGDVTKLQIPARVIFE